MLQNVTEFRVDAKFMTYNKCNKMWLNVDALFTESEAETAECYEMIYKLI